MTRAALYARVSRPDEQRILENQLLALREYRGRRKFDDGGEYVDVASGGSDDRPNFSRLLKDAARGRPPFDLVVFTSLSRMTRGGVAAALEVLRQLERDSIGWVFVDQPVLNNDSSTPKLARDILLAVLAALDEDYRNRISQATKSAYARRKQAAEALGQTVKWGRPRKRVPPAPAAPEGSPGIGTISPPLSGHPASPKPK